MWKKKKLKKAKVKIGERDAKFCWNSELVSSNTKKMVRKNQARPSSKREYKSADNDKDNIISNNTRKFTKKYLFKISNIYDRNELTFTESKKRTYIPGNYYMFMVNFQFVFFSFIFQKSMQSINY